VIQLLLQFLLALNWFTCLVQEDNLRIVDAEQAIKIALGHVLLEQTADFFRISCWHFYLL
jgi:hypothetical protein